MRLNTQPQLFGLRKLFAPLDGVMIFVLILIAALSAVTMYSASSDIPDRFPDHIRNLIIGFFVMLTFAYIPPQWLMKAAVPLYALGVNRRGGCRANPFGGKALVEHWYCDPAIRVVENCCAPHVVVLFPPHGCDQW